MDYFTHIFIQTVYLGVIGTTFQFGDIGIQFQVGLSGLQRGMRGIDGGEEKEGFIPVPADEINTLIPLNIRNNR